MRQKIIFYQFLLCYYLLIELDQEQNQIKWKIEILLNLQLHLIKIEYLFLILLKEEFPLKIELYLKDIFTLY